MKLALKVADIIDELKIITNLLKNQLEVIISLENCHSVEEMHAVDKAENIEKHIKSVITTVKEIKTEAEATYKGVSTKRSPWKTLG